MSKKDVSSVKSRALTITGIVMCVILVPILIINCILLVKGWVSGEVPDLGGKVPLIVLTDSMYPDIKSGDLIVCTTIAPKDVKEGMVISFYDPASKTSAVVTHKVVERIEEDGKLYFRTKGINNNTEDRLLVPAENVIAKYNGFRIPYAGNIAMFMQTTTGLLVCVILPIILLVGYDFLRRKKYEKTQGQDVEALMAELEALKAMQNAANAPTEEEPQSAIESEDAPTEEN